MTHPLRTSLVSLLLGDELGQIKLIQLLPERSLVNHSNKDIEHQALNSNSDGFNHSSNHRHRIIRILDDSLQKEPANSRAITNIRPIESIYETHLDTTDKPNNLFLITNKVGQMFVCNTDAVRQRLNMSHGIEANLANNGDNSWVPLRELEDSDNLQRDMKKHEMVDPMLSPIYYNMNSKVPVCGGQPINQTNILIIYQNGDIQHVNIGQDVLQSSLKIKRKAIRMLGMGYNCDARAVHWHIDGSSGICYFDADAASSHMNEKDPLTDFVLSSPTHKLDRKRIDRSQHNLYNQSPCIKSRKFNEQDRLIPTQVINMITSHAEHYKPSSRICKWSSITSLNLIYRKLALYDLIGQENFAESKASAQYVCNSYKLNDNRLAIGGHKYALRVYDVQTQKSIYNCRTSLKNPLACPAKGEPITIGDVDWLGGNKTTKKSANMLATCSGIDSVVNVYDLRSSKPAFRIDLTSQTEDKWQPSYENYHRGCMFTRICSSGAPYSTAVPSQQLALGSTNGQLHVVDLRFAAKSFRSLGKLSGFCGGSIREIRFVSESFETSKMISCATDRFVRIHRIQTSFTSVISQKLATKVFLGTKPTCIQPVCDEITQSYLASVVPLCGSESNISTTGSGGWSL